MKQYLYISNVDAFLNNSEYSAPFSISSNAEMHEIEDDYPWIFVKEIEIDISGIDREYVTSCALGLISKQEQKEKADHQMKMDLLEQKRQSLLSIEHKPDA